MPSYQQRQRQRRLRLRQRSVLADLQVYNGFMTGARHGGGPPWAPSWSLMDQPQATLTLQAVFKILHVLKNGAACRLSD